MEVINEILTLDNAAILMAVIVLIFQASTAWGDLKEKWKKVVLVGSVILGTVVLIISGIKSSNDEKKAKNFEKEIRHLNDTLEITQDALVKANYELRISVDTVKTLSYVHNTQVKNLKDAVDSLGRKKITMCPYYLFYLLTAPKTL